MGNDDGAKFNIIGEAEIRRGVYANAAFITSQKTEDYIDFIFSDVIDATGSVNGILATRVIMPHETLIQLRDAINRHLEKTVGE